MTFLYAIKLPDLKRLATSTAVEGLQIVQMLPIASREIMRVTSFKGPMRQFLLSRGITDKNLVSNLNQLALYLAQINSSSLTWNEVDMLDQSIVAHHRLFVQVTWLLSINVFLISVQHLSWLDLVIYIFNVNFLLFWLSIRDFLVTLFHSIILQLVSI